MTEDLTPLAGRVFVGEVGTPHLKLITIKSVRRRRDGTPSSCVITWETGEVRAQANMRLPKDGKMHGFRRVTLERIGYAKAIADVVGLEVPTDSIVIVTRDRTGGTPDIFKT